MNNTKMDTNDSVVAVPPLLMSFDRLIWSVRSVVCIRFVWLNNANQMNQTDQTGEATVLRNYAMEQ